jgi:hypothetical protein
MDTFPVAPELLHAFPLGALSLLVTMASTVAAQHGVDRARSICGELASNDELWRFIARRVERRAAIVDGADAGAFDELSTPPDDSGGRETAAAEEFAAGTSVDQNNPTAGDVTSAPEPETVESTSAPHDGPPRGRLPKSKGRRRQKANGAGR